MEAFMTLNNSTNAVTEIAIEQTFDIQHKNKRDILYVKYLNFQSEPYT